MKDIGALHCKEEFLIYVSDGTSSLFTGSGKLLNLVTQSLVSMLSNGNAKGVGIEGVSSRAITAHLNSLLLFYFDHGNRRQQGRRFQWQ